MPPHPPSTTGHGGKGERGNTIARGKERKKKGRGRDDLHHYLPFRGGRKRE